MDARKTSEKKFCWGKKRLKESYVLKPHVTLSMGNIGWLQIVSIKHVKVRNNISQLKNVTILYCNSEGMKQKNVVLGSKLDQRHRLNYCRWDGGKCVKTPSIQSHWCCQPLHATCVHSSNSKRVQVQNCCICYGQVEAEHIWHIMDKRKLTLDCYPAENGRTLWLLLLLRLLQMNS